ncbi:Asp/Glu racemase [Paraburkholderia sp. USG1]|nr:Asp/Glu racemase [Paraburkholderia sp. USG1]
MEREIPAMLHSRELVEPERFTFHSSRMRMKQVTKEELESMDRDSDRCAAELADAQVDVLGYACLVAIMSMGHGYHRVSEERLTSVVEKNGCYAPVVTSAGALVDGLRTLGVQRIALIAPYMKPLTQMVVDYLEREGIRVMSHLALEIPDNLEVGARDPNALRAIYRQLDLSDADAVVLSACVQMPSLAAIQAVQEECGKPVVSASVCTTYAMLKKLGLRTYVPNAGELLSGRY